MSKLTLSRRTFLKSAAIAAGAAAIGVRADGNLVESNKAWAVDNTYEVRTSCRACIHNCGIIATVTNGRVVSLRGDDIDPMSKGRVCPKGVSGIQALYHPNRNKYPMKRVGGKPGNEWERISWDEACEIVAQAMMDMAEKTGKHGLLCSTGGGGNPQFFSPTRFRNFWGAGNVFEPGCAQCYLPRNYTMPLINGIGDTSIADSGCSELYKPAKYGGLAEVYVMWGVAPAWNAPASAGRCVAELRANGCKTIVIDPRFTPDAAKADIWLPIRSGTDVAMILGWLHYIIEHELYHMPEYEDFVEKWTNLPFLVDPRDQVKLPAVTPDLDSNGQLLRASEVFDDIPGEGYLYYDTVKNKVVQAFPMTPENESEYNPALFGSYEVTLKDGTTIQCKTAGEAYRERCEEYTLERTAEITGCPADRIEAAIKLYCSSAHGGITLGVATDQYPASSQAALGAAALDCWTAHLYHTGCPANSVGTGRAAESTIFPDGFIGEAAYQFQTNEAIQERLGYVEHKGLGGWMHSHIPTVLNAILTGEPYQPKVWIERSGNKFHNLANSSSWLDAIPKLDLIAHCYMYPTSFTTEAADVVFPAAEWLETCFVQGRLNVTLLRQPVVNLFECADETMMWGGIAKKLADLGDVNMQNAFNPASTGPIVPTYWEHITDYWDWVATQAQCANFEEAKAKLPAVVTPDDEYWGQTKYDQNYLGLNNEAGSSDAAAMAGAKGNAITVDGAYKGFSGCAANDIVYDPHKCGPYGDTLLYIGRHGKEKFEMPPASTDYNPMPYFFEPEDYTQYRDEYPLVLSEGRIPFYHHGTLRNNPYLRELYPAPEIWISPEDAAKYGIEEGEWVNVHSPRTDGLDVFSNLATGEQLTAEGQAVVADGINGVAKVTSGIIPGEVYMERFWNPEFLEDGKDTRKSWTVENMNVLTKNTGWYNPEFGTYTLRGINVRVQKTTKPEGIWYDATDFEPWMPTPSENTGGGCQ